MRWRKHIEYKSIIANNVLKYIGENGKGLLKSDRYEA